MNRPGVNVELAHIEQERGAVGDPLGLDFPGLVAGNRRRVGERRIVQGIEETERTGELLVGQVDSGIEAVPDARRELVAEIGVEVLRPLGLVVPIAVGIGDRTVDQEVDRAGDPRDLEVLADRVEGAAVDAQDIRREGGLGRGRDDVNRPAQGGRPRTSGRCRPCRPRSSAAPGDRPGRVAAAVREVQGDAVLK